jgi:hypothetical protein
MKHRHTNTLTVICYAAAIGLAGFSGAVATYGLTKFAPGAVAVVAVMGALFEVGKLSAFSLMHRPLPRVLKTALAAVGLVLVGLNVAGVSGFLSSAYEGRKISGEAQHTQGATIAAADVADLRTQLVAIDTQLATARAAVVKARDNRDRAKAAQSVVDKAQVERDWNCLPPPGSYRAQRQGRGEPYRGERRVCRGAVPGHGHGHRSGRGRARGHRHDIGNPRRARGPAVARGDPAGTAHREDRDGAQAGDEAQDRQAQGTRTFAAAIRQRQCGAAPAIGSVTTNRGASPDASS